MQNHLLVKDLHKSYGKRQILFGIDMEIRSGQVVGILGPNGAGKTTCFYMIAGLVKVDKGSIFFNDQDITEFSIHQRSAIGIGYLPQEASLFRGMSVEENIYSIIEIVEKKKNKREKLTILSNILEEFSISHIRKSNAMSLSGGERRRVEIARAIVANPSILLLDEPFAGIDPISVFDIISVINRLKEKGIGILITDHNVRETLDVVDFAYIVYDGKVIAKGDKIEILADNMVRKVYLGEDFK